MLLCSAHTLQRIHSEQYYENTGHAKIVNFLIRLFHTSAYQFVELDGKHGVFI